MLISKSVAVIAAFALAASTHGSTGLPRIMGLDRLDRRAENLIGSFKTGSLFGNDANDKSVLEARKDDRECGEGIGSCSQEKCCSTSGYCGTTPNHCISPGCNYKYGPACPENQHPDGKNTSSIPRPKFGSVPYGGTGVFKCKNPGNIALTFDDGPHKDFTDHILDLFKSYNAKATFFITGNSINKGQIDKTQEHIDAIKRMDVEGHQIASHTWTHLNLAQVSSEDRKNQIWNVEMALNNIVGRIPTYLRPPYSSCDEGCQRDMGDLGYHLIYFDVDTDDYQQINASRIQNSKDWFKGNITKNGATPKTNDWLTISHDIIEQTANNLTEYMLSTLTQLGYKAVTVGECLGDPEENWYRQFGDSADRTGNSSTSVSSSISQTSSSSSSGVLTPSSSSSLPTSSSSTSAVAAPEQITSLASKALPETGLVSYGFSALLLFASVAIIL